jgi:RNA polymerase sigma factor (sigma-70 family)
MSADSDLLRRYAEEGSEDAFAELVRRHLDLVYAAALRQVGDPHRAEDVAQAVFADLARKAAALCRRPVLISWLYASTHYAAAKTIRTEMRRQAREQEAHTMQELLSHSTSEADWDQLRPILDSAVNELEDDDRSAVLLRFFEGKSFADVGEALGLNEDAARKRVDRSLDRLHGLLARRGVTSTAAALATILASQPVVAAPAGLAVTTTAGALAAAHGNTVTFLHLMSMTKAKIGIITAIIAAGAVGLVVQQQTNAKLRVENAGLLQESQAAAQLRDENQRLAKDAGELAALRHEHAELVELRGTVAALKSQAQTARTATAVGTASGAKDSPAGNLVAVADMTNQGRATPRAAGQTIAWAIHHGEIDIAASLITFSAESREKLEALITTLPDNLRSEYGTPEKLMAFVMAGTPHPIQSLQVLDEAQQGPDDYVQHVQIQYEDGRSRVDPIRFHQTADGWQQVMGATTVDRVITYLKSGSLPPPVVKK